MFSFEALKGKGRMAQLTPRQKEIYDFIRNYLEEHGYSPTYEEIGSALGICKVTVLAHLRRLERKGVLQREHYRRRSIELCRTEGQTKIPVVGIIQAGRPILAFEEPEKIDLFELVPQKEDLYSLRVRGDSMLEEHIRDGDYVIVQKCDVARPGEVVVALIDGEEATLKRFFPEGPYVRLEAANPAYEPILIERNRVRSQGRVVGVLRLFRK